jgi:hypothetical protein
VEGLDAAAAARKFDAILRREFTDVLVDPTDLGDFV